MKIKTVQGVFYKKFIKAVTKTISASNKAVIQNSCQLLKTILMNCIVSLEASVGRVFITMMHFLSSLLLYCLWVCLLCLTLCLSMGNPDRDGKLT